MIRPGTGIAPMSADGRAHDQEPAQHLRPTVLFVCTGNAARSVMAATLLRHRTGELIVESAGTHSIPGLPMSTRTRNALAGFEVGDPDHRSAQLDDAMAERAALIAVFEPMHLNYIRRRHPSVAARAASLARWTRDLDAGPIATLSDRVAAADMASHEFEPWEEIVDPAGGEQADFVVAAQAIARLIDSLSPRLGI